MLAVFPCYANPSYWCPGSKIRAKTHCKLWFDNILKVVFFQTFICV